MNKRIIYFLIGFILFLAIIVSGASIIGLARGAEPKETQEDIHSYIVEENTDFYKDEEEDEEEENLIEDLTSDDTQEVITEDVIVQEDQVDDDAVPDEETQDSQINDLLEETEEDKVPVYGEDQGLMAYYRLSDEEQALYDELLTAVTNRQAYVDITVPADEEMLDKCISCIDMDHPELYWFYNGYTYWNDSTTGLLTKVEPHYQMTESEVVQYRDIIKKNSEDIIYGISRNATDYEKVQYVYESVIQCTDYVKKAPYNQSMASVFVNGQTVCAGYAKAVQYILHELGVGCLYVVGDAGSGADRERHAWNIVEIDDSCYVVDATWGDPIGMDDKMYICYDYLCRSDEFINRSHTLDVPIDTPACTDDTKNYYILNNMWYVTYDAEKIKSNMAEQLVKGETMRLAFADADAYQKAMKAVQNGDFNKMANEVKNGENPSLDFWVYDTTYLIEVTWK